MDNNLLIEVKEIKKIYKCKKSDDVVAVNDISFGLPDRGIVFILGRSGSGKSTLLNLLGGLDGFDGGDIVVGGKSMRNFTAADYDAYRNDNVGFVFQENNLLDGYTVAQNIGLALDLKKEKDYGDKIEAVLEAVDLKDYASRKPNRISGGQKQRVAIARALVKKPKILLCDEPTGSLDSATSEGIFKLLKRISTDSLVIVVSHDRDSAERFGDRIIEISDGKKISDSKPLTAGAACNEEALQGARCGLPAGRALSIGAGFLAARPIRLCLCAFICLITFICIAIADSVACYDRSVALAQTMQSYGTPCVSYLLQKREYADESISDETSYMSRWELEKLQEALGGQSLGVAYNYFLTTCYNIDFLWFDAEGNGYLNADYDNYNLYGFTEINEDLVKDYGFTLYGDYPTGYGEVVLSRLVFLGFERYGYISTDKKERKAISDYDDLIGCTVTLDRTTFTVSGILDTCFDEETYKDLLTDGTPADSITGSRFRRLKRCGMHNLLYLAEGYYENEIVAAGTAEKNGEDICFAYKPFDARTAVSDIHIEDLKFDYGGGKWYAQFKVMNDAYEVIDMIDMQMKFIQPLFLWISVGAIIISVLFVLYYSSGVVAEKNKEVGVLRALGASRADILKIFIAENGLFVAAVILLSTVLGIVGVFVANSIIVSGLGVTAVVADFSLRQFCIMAATAIGAVAVGILIPLIRILYAKPVDVLSGRK